MQMASNIDAAAAQDRRLWPLSRRGRWQGSMGELPCDGCQRSAPCWTVARRLARVRKKRSIEIGAR